MLGACPLLKVGVFTIRSAWPDPAPQRKTTPTVFMSSMMGASADNDTAGIFSLASSLTIQDGGSLSVTATGLAQCYGICADGYHAGALVSGQSASITIEGEAQILCPQHDDGKTQQLRHFCLGFLWQHVPHHPGRSSGQGHCRRQRRGR